MSAILATLKKEMQDIENRIAEGQTAEQRDARLGFNEEGAKFNSKKYLEDAANEIAMRYGALLVDYYPNGRKELSGLSTPYAVLHFTKKKEEPTKEAVLSLDDKVRELGGKLSRSLGRESSDHVFFNIRLPVEIAGVKPVTVPKKVLGLIKVGTKEVRIHSVFHRSIFCTMTA